MKLSIIIPTYNEENTIVDVVNRIDATCFPIECEIIIVDDVSIDSTFEKQTQISFKNERNGKYDIRLFRNRLNKGKSFSVRKGIRQSRGDFIIVQDGDDKYDPQEIPKLLEPVLKGEADVVCESRFLSSHLS